MVYAKYIKRDGKRFGPYYYKSVRTKDGKVKNVYIGTKLPKKKKQKKQKKVTLQKSSSLTNSTPPTIYSRVLAISTILIITLLFLNVYFEKTGISTLPSFSLSQKLHYTSFSEFSLSSPPLTGYIIYAGGGGNNSNMTLWDETDEELGSNATKFINHQIDFFANYTNATDGTPINGTNISCKIRFNTTGTYTDYINMSFNNSSLLYEYNRSFTAPETLDWNVFCNGTEQSYDNLNATDTTIISDLYLTNPQPNTTQTSQTFLLSIKASGEVSCKYSINQNVSYEDMGNLMTEVNDTEDIHHAPLTLLSGDTYNIYFTCKDLIGDNYVYTNTSFYVDSIAPYITATAPEGTQTTTLVTIYANTSTNANCKYSTTDTNFSSMTNNFTNTGTTEHNRTLTSTQGLNTYYIRCNDSFGNTMTSSALILFEVDSIAPTSPSLLSPANDSYHNQTPTFSWGASSSAVNYTINITNSTDTVNYSTTNLTTFTPQTLEEENYTWKVRATDEVGNTGDWSTLRTFTIDTSAPTLSNPLPTSNQSSRTFLVSVNASETGLTCKFDTSNVNYVQMGNYLTDLGTNIYQSTLTVQQDGAYTIYFACQDSAGNIGNSSTGEFNVDSIAPYITATAPSGLQNNTSTTIYANTSTNANCKYSTTDTNFSSMTNNFTNTGTTTHNTTPTSTQGLNTYYIRCNDSFGNTMTSSALIIFEVDSISPQIPILISPTNDSYTNDNTSLLVWSASTDAYDYTLEVLNSTSDTTTNTTLNTTSYLHPALDDDNYTWRVKATDSAGNTAGFSDYFTLRVDTAVPDAPTLQDPGTYSVTGLVRWNWSSTDSDIQEYQIEITNSTHTIYFDTTNNTYYISQFITDQQYFAKVRAIDNADNTGTWSDQENITVATGVDTGAQPDVLSEYTQINSVTINWTSNNGTDGDGIQKYEIFSSTDEINYNSLFNTTDTNYTATSLSEGKIYFKVRSYDNAGNTVDSAVVSTIIDTIQPESPTLLVPTNNTYTNQITNTFGWSALPEIDHYIFRWNSTHNLTVNQSATIKTLSEGDYNWSVLSVDKAGNVGNWSNNFTLHIDTTAPTLSEPTPSSNQTSRSFMVSINASEESTCRYSINQSVTYENMGYIMTETNDTEDIHEATAIVGSDSDYTIYFACQDSAGNIGTNNTQSFHVDDTAPVIVHSGSITTDPITLFVNTSESAVCRYSIIDQSFLNMPLTNNFTTADGIDHEVSSPNNLSDQINIYYIRCAEDISGTNAMTSSAIIFFDLVELTGVIQINESLNNHIINEGDTYLIVDFNTTGDRNVSWKYDGNEYLNDSVNITNNISDTWFGYVNLTELDTWSKGIHTLKLRDMKYNRYTYSETIILRVNTTEGVVTGYLTANQTYVKNGSSIEFILRANDPDLTPVELDVSLLNNAQPTLTLNPIGQTGSYSNTLTVTNDTYTGDITLNGTAVGYTTLAFNITLTLDNTQPNSSITIYNLGETGFENISNEFTASRAVILELNYSDTYPIDTCRYSNDASDWTEWESCSATKAWLLTQEDGLKTVYYEVKDSAGNTKQSNDTIYLNKTGAGLDITPPLPPTITDQGDYTTDNESLYFTWTNASDPESEFLHFPLTYKYQLWNETTNLTGTLDIGEAEELNLTGLFLENNQTYYLNVTVINSAGLNASAISDGIVLDTILPTITFINSTINLSEYNYTNNSYINQNWSYNNNPFFNWTAEDSISGISKYSYILDTTIDTTPDDIPEYEIDDTTLHTGTNTGQNITLFNNATGVAASVAIEVKQNLTNEDILEISFELAEDNTSTTETMDYFVYALNSSPIEYNNTSTIISNIETFSTDITNNPLISADTYYANLTITQNITDGNFFIVISGDNSSINTNSLLLASTNQTIDNTTQAYACFSNETGITPRCRNHTNTMEFAISIVKDDLGTSLIWDKTYSSIGDGTYNFHVKAKDNAGNWGNTSHYHILVDSTPPTAPTLENPTQNCTTDLTCNITFTWNTVTDTSGILKYNLVIENSTAEINNINTTSTNYSIKVSDGSYTAKVRAQNGAGNWSIWSSETALEADVTPPTITFHKPTSGSIRSKEPILVVKTDEQAICTYSLDSDTTYNNYTYTNSTYHEAKISISESFEYSINCTDLSGNEVVENVEQITYDSSSVTGLSISSSPTTIYTNQQIDVEIGSSFGEIPKSEFHVFLNNTEIEYIAVVDNGAGNYTVSFNAPMENGTYGLNITVEQESVTQNIDVSQLSLQITYTDTNIGTDQLTGTRTIYYNSDNYTVGFGSESTQTNLDDGTDTLILTSNIEDGASYIFATKPNASITRTEKYLKKKEFTDLITPAFGYQIGKIHSINTLLDYDDIIIIGDVEGDVAQSGRYNLIIKNNGLTAEGKVNISVSLA